MDVNREIKFRGWHTKQRRMYSPEEMGADELMLSVNGRGFANVGDGSRLQPTQYGGDVMIPLQFTGLKDKNGREIYEGDILRIGTRTYPVVYDEQVGSFDVNADFCEIRLREGMNKRGHVMPLPIEYPEVIGNIYENPELLSHSQT